MSKTATDLKGLVSAIQLSKSQLPVKMAKDIRIKNAESVIEQVLFCLWDFIQIYQLIMIDEYLTDENDSSIDSELPLIAD